LVEPSIIGVAFRIVLTFEEIDTLVLLGRPVAWLSPYSELLLRAISAPSRPEISLSNHFLGSSPTTPFAVGGLSLSSVARRKHLRGELRSPNSIVELVLAVGIIIREFWIVPW